MAARDEKLEEEESFCLTNRPWKEVCHLNRTRETQEWLFVRQRGEDLTVLRLFVNHHDTGSGLLDVLERPAATFKFLSVNNPPSNHSCLRQTASSSTSQQGAGVQHLPSPITMCRLHIKCQLCAYLCALTLDKTLSWRRELEPIV